MNRQGRRLATLAFCMALAGSALAQAPEIAEEVEPGEAIALPQTAPLPPPRALLDPPPPSPRRRRMAQARAPRCASLHCPRYILIGVGY